MKLGERQELFMQLLPRLIDEVHRRGKKCRGGELYRTPEQAAIYAANGRGIAQSLHQVKCAIDINLFDEKGVFLSATEDHAEFGAFWESLHPNCRWGGRYRDGNHYELLDHPRT